MLMDAVGLEFSHSTVGWLVLFPQGLRSLPGSRVQVGMTWWWEAGITWWSLLSTPACGLSMSLGFLTRWRSQDSQTPYTAALASSISVPVEKEEDTLPFLHSMFFTGPPDSREDLNPDHVKVAKSHCRRACRMYSIIAPFLVNAICHKMTSREIEIYILNWIFLFFPSAESTRPQLPLSPSPKSDFQHREEGRHQ